MKEIVIERPEGLKYIGVYDEELNKVMKWVKRSEHFMWKNFSWGFDAELLRQFATRDATIELHEKESNDILTADAKLWMSEGVLEDLGHGLQYFLPEIKFKRENKYD